MKYGYTSTITLGAHSRSSNEPIGSLLIAHSRSSNESIHSLLIAHSRSSNESTHLVHRCSQCAFQVRERRCWRVLLVLRQHLPKLAGPTIEWAFWPSLRTDYIVHDPQEHLRVLLGRHLFETMSQLYLKAFFSYMFEALLGPGVLLRPTFQTVRPWVQLEGCLYQILEHGQLRPWLVRTAGEQWRREKWETNVRRMPRSDRGEEGSGRKARTYLLASRPLSSATSSTCSDPETPWLRASRSSRTFHQPNRPHLHS